MRTAHGRVFAVFGIGPAHNRTHTANPWVGVCVCATDGGDDLG